MVHVNIAAFHGCSQASLSCCALHALPFHALPIMPCPSCPALHIVPFTAQQPDSPLNLPFIMSFVKH